MSDTPKRRGPVLIETGAPARAPRPDPRPFAGQESPAPEPQPRLDHGPSPADAPPIVDAPDALPTPRSMEMVMRLAAGGPSRLTRFFLQATLGLVTFIASVMALNFIDGLITRAPLLGWIGVALFAAFTLGALGLALREYMAWARFGRIDAIHRAADQALATADLKAAAKVADDLDRLYAGRREMDWGRTRLRERRPEAFDAETLIGMAETDLLAPLDQLARREIEAAARTVAATTALVPLAFADVAAALAANLRMIRRMAEIYGGRAGAVGGWRLARMVMTHLIATGAVAVGDDLIHTVAGGGMLAKLSRRFGEGMVNGALTARVGIAAMEVCRPLPFLHQPRPKVSNLLSRAVSGLFGNEKE